MAVELNAEIRYKMNYDEFSKLIKKIVEKIEKNEKLTHDYINNEIEKIDNTIVSNVQIRKIVPKALMSFSWEEIEKVLSQLNIIYAMLYSNMATLDTTLSQDIRTVIAKRFGKDSEEHKKVKTIVKLQDVDKLKLIKDSKDINIKKINDVILFTEDEIYNKIVDNIDSDDAAKKALALSLACGSRPIELIAKSTFTDIGEKMGYGWVRQDFIAKSHTKTSLEKPILYLTTERFIKEVELMRNMFNKRYGVLTKNDEKGDEFLKPAISSILNVRAKEIFGEGHSFYASRGFYANLSYELVGRYPNENGKVIDDKAWKIYILGHNERDTDTGAYYSIYKLVKKEQKEYLPVMSNKIKERKIKERKINDKNEDKTEYYTEFIEKAIKEYEKMFNKKITQNDLEEITKGVVPRAVVRLYLKQKNEEIEGILTEVQNKIIEKIYEEQQIKPSQVKLEKLLKGIVPRSAVRRWYRYNKINEL